MSDIPGWHSPESGGSVGGTVRPFWSPLPDDLDLVPGTDEKRQTAVIENIDPEKTADTSAAQQAESGGLDMNTILIGGAVVVGVLILLTGGNGK